MLQRQIMFRQLQELQRRQQLQDLAGGRNQDYVSLKQASPVQFAPTYNGAPVHDSQMLMLDNTQMMQHDESSIYQGFPSGLVPSHSNALGSMGLSPPPFDMSLYNTPSPNTGMNLNLYSHLQDPSNHSVNLLTKNNNSPLGRSSVHPSSVASSFMNQQGNFSSDQISMPDGSLLTNQMFQDKNLFGKVPFQSYKNDLLPVNYSPQGITTQRNASEGRHADIGWPEISQEKVSKIGMSQADASLDPLEQKILYSTDDHSWGSSLVTGSKIGTGGFDCTVENPSYLDTSIQSGSWSALMQSAVAETSSSDTAIQEEWSGLSFQNPEPSSYNQPSNFINSEQPQNDWVDRNLQNVSSPSSEPEQLFQKSNLKRSFSGFEQSGHQYLSQKDEFQSEASHISGQHSPSGISHLADYNSQLKHPTGGTQLVQTSLPSEGHELKDALWLHGGTSNSVSGGIQMLFDQGNSSATSLPSRHDKGYFKNQHPASPVPSHMTTKLPAYGAASSSQVNFGGPGFPLLENAAVTQPSGASAVAQRVGFPTGHPTPWPDITIQQDVSSTRTNKFSSSLFQCPGLASSSLETSSGAPNEQSSQNCFKYEHNMQEFDTRSGQSGYHDQRLEQVSFLHEGSTETDNPTPPSRNTETQQSLRKHYSEVDGVASGTLMIQSSQEPSDQAEQKDNEISVVPASDIRAFGHSLHQDYSLLQKLHYPRDAQTDRGKRFPFKCESIEYQQAIAKAKELLVSGQNSLVKEKSDQEAVQVGAFSPGDNKGWKLSQEAQEDQSGKASSAYLQNFQQMQMAGQNDSQNHTIGSNEGSNVAYQSQISLQMAPSWFKHYGTLKNGQVLPMYNTKAAITSAQTFSGLSIGNLQENIMQVNSANANQGNGTWPSSAPTLIASKHLSPSSLLPSSVTYQNLAVPKPKKRKIVAFDMVPWHKEVNCEAPRLQNISEAAFEWPEASNRRQEEATYVAEIVDYVVPMVQAKRRLIFTTQLMQQVLRPVPAGILFADASSNGDCVAYSAARLALGDACNLNSKLPSDTNDMSPDKLKTSKRTTARDFSKVVESLTSRVKKLEGDLSRLDRNLSIVDIKVESQELDKFSTLNRFAKFHIKAQPSTVDPASSSGPSTVQKPIPRRYVIAVPMPKIVPEDIDCLAL